MLNNLGQPPVGSGGYAQWFVFVVVIVLSLMVAEVILHAVGLKKRG